MSAKSPVEDIGSSLAKIRGLKLMIEDRVDFMLYNYKNLKNTVTKVMK
ncbi:MAG: hypothetical protein L6N95_00290 [Candidatus Methylarchaceae archaeon HK01B]|nr:hypothetical protein [Candidatus Methylarchaceae archaeon HK01M]MCP8311509.1 hypothetical protein [Candidatus Methylarchaceae archaeon HK02M1]MCP8318250.1 hypothetical protein [Candidatus Methylarchaceae archaeon HK01B]